MKNRKKNLRKITVEGREWKWLTDSEGHLIIYDDEKNQVFKSHALKKSRGESFVIRPKLVDMMIRSKVLRIGVVLSDIFQLNACVAAIGWDGPDLLDAPVEELERFADNYGYSFKYSNGRYTAFNHKYISEAERMDTSDDLSIALARLCLRDHGINCKIDDEVAQTS